MRGREFEDQVHTFSCLGVLHNAVVAWNTKQIGLLVERLRATGQDTREEDLSQTSPLYRKHINLLGRYYIDVQRMKRVQTTD